MPHFPRRALAKLTRCPLHWSPEEICAPNKHSVGMNWGFQCPGGSWRDPHDSARWPTLALPHDATSPLPGRGATLVV